MKKYILLSLALFVYLSSSAQQNDIAIGDIDLDGVADTVRIDREKGVIISSLSSTGFSHESSRPMRSLRGNGSHHLTGLSALHGTFQLLFLDSHASCYFNFVYDEKRKGVYLDEYWAEQLGVLVEDVAYEFYHSLRRRCVDYWIRRYFGEPNADDSEMSPYRIDKAIARVRRMRIPFKRFSDEKYYRKTEQIWRKHMGIIRG